MSFPALFLAMAPASGQSQQSPMHFMVMMGLFFAILYVMMIRPQQRKEKERKAMLANVKKGDRVLFSGGILGEVVQTEEKTLKIKIADNVRVEVTRGAVYAILAKDEPVSDIVAP
jgi:preprotein translocase subunit YajC